MNKKNNIIFLTSLLLIVFFALAACEIADYPYFIKNKKTDHGMLWVANAGENSVTCIDRINDKTIGTYDVGPSPSRTAVDLDGNCWVGSRGDDTVYFVTTEGETKKYEGFNAARGVSLDREGNVWIANSGNNTIQKIEIKTETISEQVKLAGASLLYGSLIDSNGFLWVADQTGRQMFKYDTSKFPDPNAFVTVACTDLYGFTIDSNGKIWAAGLNSPLLIKIDANRAEVEEEYTIPSEIFGGRVCAVTFDSKGKIWITNDDSASVIRFDPDTITFDYFNVSGSWPHGLGASDDGHVFCVNNNSDSVSKIDIETGAEIFTYKVGLAPYTYSDLTGFIYRHVTLKDNSDSKRKRTWVKQLFEIL